MTDETPTTELAQVVPKKVRLWARIAWWSVCLVVFLVGSAGLAGLVIYDHVMSPGMPLAETEVSPPSEMPQTCARAMASASMSERASAASSATE